MTELNTDTTAVNGEGRALLDRQHHQRVSMCEACEIVPVPVFLMSHSGLYLCASCLAEDGIHMGEDE